MRYIFNRCLLCSVCFAFILPVNASAQGQSTAPDQVTLQLKWKHQFQFAGYYAAIEQGFYKDENLNVNLLEAKEGEEPAEAVFHDKADFGVTTSDILIMRSKGKKAVLLASIFQHSAQILIASKDSGIESAQGLYGKRIALEPHAADIITFLNDEGISLNEVILYPHNFDVTELTAGEVDALTAYISDEPFSLREAGVDYTIIDPGMGGIDFYGDVLFTTETLIETEPELVERFRRASLKGWEYAMSHTNEIADLIYEKYTQRHSPEHLRFEAQKMQKLIMPDVVEIGYANAGRWGKILEIYEEQRMLDSAITLDGLFYTDYIQPKRAIPWRLISIFSVSFIVIASATLFYYNTARKLKIESKKRLKAQEKLERSEQSLKESNAAKDKFFSILAHDLRNPFSAVIGLTDLLIMDAKAQDNESQLETLKIIRETSFHTSDLLSNLLIWSRSQVGNIKYNPEVFDLAEVINKNMALVRSQATQKKIVISSHIDSNSMIFGDRNMINTILLNLLTNAIKFTEPGSEGSIDVGLTLSKTQVEVYVKDEGIGISEENIDKLFSIDTKFSSEGTASEKGSGLGLLLCKEFVEKHNGKIRIESTPGEGSTFWITLPRFKTY